MAVKVGINGFGRIGRNIMRAALGDQEHRLRRGERPHQHRRRWRICSSTTPSWATSTRTSRPRATRSRSTATASRCSRSRIPHSCPWKDLGVEVVFEGTGLFTDRDAAAKHLAGRREEGHHHGARQEARPDDGHGREQRDLRPGEAPHHLERVVHDQLPGALREGAARRVPDRPGLDDDHPLVHERSATARSARTRICGARARRRSP